MVEILDKTKEWSERFGQILKASAATQFPHLYKGAVGGLEHVISVDNGGSYMEMWRDGGDQYYATTGAAIKPLPGLAKGARLDEALDRFFVLMTKKGMDRRAQARQRPQRKAIPKKIKRLAGVRKNIVEKVDPEIGPSMSVGHRKPSDLSPESSMRKLAKRIIADINKAIRPTPQATTSTWKRTQAAAGAPKRPTKKNVVALTGNQPGSGRVKPARTRMVRQHEDKQGSTAHHKRGRGGVAAQQVEAGDWIRTKAGLRGKVVSEGFVGTRKWPAFKVDMGGGRMTAVIKEDAQLWHKAEPMAPPMKEEEYRRTTSKNGGRRLTNIEGGRTQPGGGTRPVQPRQSGPGVPTGYAPKTGATEFSQRQPTYDYSRYRKACPCNEVAKTMRAVEDKGMPTTYRVTGPGGKRSKPIKLPKGAR